MPVIFYGDPLTVYYKCKGFLLWKDVYEHDPAVWYENI